jgi:polysaccharide biosynthesis transport protein
MITLGDIYYILFRHKWKIAVLAVLGVVGSLLLPMAWPQVYECSAELLIKYVADTGIPTGPNGDGSRTMYVDPTGRNIINTEMHVISSLDLAQEVATNVGAAKIVGMEASTITAAAVIHKNMRVDNPDGSDIIRIFYQHKDPTVAQTVLNQVVKTYLDRHAKLHQLSGPDDTTFMAVRDDWKRKLKQTEDQLSEIRSNLDVVSFEDTAKVFGEQVVKIQNDLFEAQSDLAQHQAIQQELTRRSNEIEQHYANLNAPNTNAVASGTNAVDSGTNAVAQQSASSAVTPPSPELISEYQDIKEKISRHRTEENDLLKIYLPENSRVKEMHAQVVAAEQQKKQMERDNPGLIMSLAADSTKPGDTGAPTVNRFVEESAQIAALEKKIELLSERLKFVRGRAAQLDARAFEIEGLEHTRKSEAENFDYFQKIQAKRSADENYGSKSSNIDVIQQPFAPSMDKSKLKNVQRGLAVAGLLFGLGLAFLIEMYIDRTVKRPVDIESKLGVPLFLSIPYRNGKGNQRLLAAPPATSLTLRWEAKDRSFTLNGSKTTIGRNAGSTVAVEDESVSEHHCEIFNRNGEVMVKDLGSATGTFVDGQRIVEATLKPEQTLRVGSVEFSIQKHVTKAVQVSKKSSAAMPPWDPRHALRPFYDTLRDRLITYFEVKNLTHNPKLVALTSCGDSAGVTSTAAGLAAALSETGEGNVLLVDMNVERGAAHHFYKGHLSCGIDEALKKDTRAGAKVQDNLYVVTESNSNDENSLQRVLPKRFTSLVPKLKASDYDYIIFDMPPMSQISITPRLARFMDMVMVVVESEKTDREVVQRAVNMLTEAKANVGVVLNKRKNYVPKQLQQEL